MNFVVSLLFAPLLLGPVWGHYPQMSLTTNTSLVIEGRPVAFTCNASCYPSASNIQLYLGADKLGLMGRPEVTERGPDCVDTVRAVVITPIRRVHQGLPVRCLVVNWGLNRTMEKQIPLAILGPPVDTSICVRKSGRCEGCRNCRANVTQGHSVELECSALGSNPASRLAWEFLGQGGGSGASPVALLHNSSAVSPGNASRGSWDSLGAVTIAPRHGSRGSVEVVCLVLYPDDGSTVAEERVTISVLPGEDQDGIWKLVTICNGSLILAILVALLCYVTVRIVKTRKTKAWTRRSRRSSDRLEDAYCPSIELKGRRRSTEIARKAGSTETQPGPAMSDLEFPRSRLFLLRVIGDGHFGQVHKGIAKGIVRDGEDTKVAVKIIRGETSPSAMSDFKHELRIFKSMEKHPHVVSFLGCCTTTEPFYLIMELVPHGSLETFVRGKQRAWAGARQRGVAIKEALSATQILTFAYQIANGMQYLSSLNLIHRDLAARNVLLGKGMVCKLCDFGLARDVTGTEQYDMLSGGAVPVRWLALECLTHNVYTTMSDAWSFGVLLWELATLGALPYPEMSPDVITESLKEGLRLPRPVHCKIPMYNLMCSCWQATPEKRPSFNQLMSILDGFLKNNPEVLDMSRFQSDLYDTLQK